MAPREDTDPQRPRRDPALTVVAASPGPLVLLDEARTAVAASYSVFRDFEMDCGVVFGGDDRARLRIRRAPARARRRSWQ